MSESTEIKNETKCIADVVFLRRNISDSFSYIIPDTILADFNSSRDLLGQSVVVPLGSQLTVGLIVEVTPDNENELSDLKPVTSIVEQFEPLPEDLVELGKWISNYYVTPINQVFKAILPQRYLPTPRPYWKCENESNLPESMDSSYEEIIRTRDEIFLDDLRDRVSDSKSTILNTMKNLEEVKAVNKKLEFKTPEVSRRTLNYLELVADFSHRDEFRTEATEKQLELLEYMEQETGCFQRDLPDSLNQTRLIQKLVDERLLEKDKRPYRRSPFMGQAESESPDEFELTDDQDRVLRAIRSDLEPSRFEGHLIHGVTGSGKTEVYFRLCETVLEQDRTGLILVPEITLATFQVSRFRERFGEALAILHSGLSKGERLDEWNRIHNGEAQIVLGVQSAVFAPLDDLGVIVVDEEHDSSYKSGQSPRYHARDAAVVRARLNDIPIVLGSATPSIESYSNAVRGRYSKHEMNTRPLEGELPNVTVTDLRGSESLLTEGLISETKQVLESGRKAIWFLNRRGQSNFMLCEECGEVVHCNQCNVSLTLHGSPAELRCHYCGYRRDIPNTCPNCSSEELDAVGMGTQQLTEYAGKLFDDVDIIRMDKDTVTKKRARFEKLDRFGESGSKLLIGTQMVTKGLDFAGVGFVGVVHADTGLKFPDFRSGERTFQQLVQVCGRAGRKQSGGLVHIQSHNPGHYAILHGKNGDYESFYGRELETRNPLGYPPFKRLINVIARAPDENVVAETLRDIRNSVSVPSDAEWLGPSPCAVDYTKGKYRWHLMARGHFSMDFRETLTEAIESASGKATVVVDVDPMDVM